VTDNGKGIPEEKIGDPRSLGLLGMRERARSLGGEIRVSGKAGGGTTITAAIPLN
jgi:signal transduction histidine kinase